MGDMEARNRTSITRNPRAIKACRVLFISMEAKGQFIVGLCESVCNVVCMYV